MCDPYTGPLRKLYEKIEKDSNIHKTSFHDRI